MDVAMPQKKHLIEVGWGNGVGDEMGDDMWKKDNNNSYSPHPKKLVCHALPLQQSQILLPLEVLVEQGDVLEARVHGAEKGIGADGEEYAHDNEKDVGSHMDVERKEGGGVGPPAYVERHEGNERDKCREDASKNEPPASVHEVARHAVSRQPCKEALLLLLMLLLLLLGCCNAVGPLFRVDLLERLLERTPGSFILVARSRSGGSRGNKINGPGARDVRSHVCICHL